jgi:segregation and condensation protein A
VVPVLQNQTLSEAVAAETALPDRDTTPDIVDGVALARLYGEPLFKVPDGLYIPPDALEVFLESFEGPLDLLLYLIRKQKFDIMDIPMAIVTEQYMQYVELIRSKNLELAAEYLVMAADLMHIKSLLLLPVKKADTDEEVEDPQAELARRLLEYEKMKLAARDLDAVPREGRDFLRAFVMIDSVQQTIEPDVLPADIAGAWQAVLEQVRLKSNHQIQRQELSVREYMTSILRKLQQNAFVEFKNLFEPQAGIGVAIVNYLAILELAKEGLIRITQAAPFAPLFVHGQAPAQQQQLELTHA